MSLLALTVGVLLVVSVLADVVNTLVSTTTSRNRMWLTHLLYTCGWRVVRSVATRVKNDAAR